MLNDDNGELNVVSVMLPLGNLLQRNSSFAESRDALDTAFNQRHIYRAL